jgi:hypothetical protein
MRRIHLIGAAAAVLVLAVAVAAYAVPASETTFDFESTAKPRNAGTKANPQAETVELEMTGGTTTGSGSPSTSTDIVIQMPSTLKWFGSKWPRSKRCARGADAADDCPRGSKVGTGHVTATAQPDPTRPKIVEEIDLTAYILNNGGLGLLIRGTTPVAFTAMLQGRITRRNTRISVHIPDNVQEPVPGVPTGIEDLRFTLSGKVTVRTRASAAQRRRQTYGAISSVGCKNRRWRTTVINIYRDGRKTDSDSSPCRK